MILYVILLCVSLFFVFNYVLTIILRNFTSARLVPCLISLLHSIILFLCGELYGVYSDNLILFSTCYFTYDSFNIILQKSKYSKDDVVYIIHHIFVIVGLYVVLTNNTIRESLPILTFVVGKIELSSAVSHIINILELLKCNNYKNIMILLKILNVIVWSYCRLLLVYLSRDSLFVGSMAYVFTAIVCISIMALFKFIINIKNN